MSEESDSDQSAEGDADGRPQARSATRNERPAENGVDDAELEELAEEDDYEPSVSGVFGARPEDAPPRPEIDPESPDIENALFVLVGVLFGLFVVYRAVVVFGG